MKKVPIFQRTKLNNIDFLYQSFPVEGIIMFCNKFRQEVQKDKAVYLPEGNTEASSMIFDWIQRCLDAGSIEDFEIVSHSISYSDRWLTLLQSDEYSPGVFSRYADIVNAAEYLEIPDRDVAEKVIKRLKGMARMQRDQDRRITFDELGELGPMLYSHSADINRGLLRKPFRRSGQACLQHHLLFLVVRSLGFRQHS